MFILFRSVSLSHEYYCLFSPLLVPLWSCYFFYQSSFSLKSYYSKSKHDSEINSIIFKLVVICSLYYLLLRNYISLYFHPLYFNPIYWLVAYRSLYHKYLLIFLVLLLDHQIPSKYRYLLGSQDTSERSLNLLQVNFTCMEFKSF